ncbi:SNO glutamine amidotransferase family-domain-containing protein [Tricharina praecox]|uniref:SNO glutamine amidotransferase family-domain-containing protein n=1 Tax=Tricharina praecox TaxID=43433 RepID=UPI00221E989E|nr:SNO glutamine amidotransferase family-domain-containing protein [Tricharina praecox]KAI5857525.1 SNO glutamine amidotransferase family-domain-containing protein [Tricharina praecox]
MNGTTPQKKTAVVGVLALQGAFDEHVQLLRKASSGLPNSPYTFSFLLVKTPLQLASCSALIIPGGESTTMALIAERSGLLSPLREFVKVSRRPTWGTCAGMILLSESANRTKAGGQELIGGLDVRVNRNHFGRQVESFTEPLRLEFLGPDEPPFMGVFIRAPVVEAVLPHTPKQGEEQVHAPSLQPRGDIEREFTQDGVVQILAELRRGTLPKEGLDQMDRPFSEEDAVGLKSGVDHERERERSSGDARVVAVRQGNVVGTSFHPELRADARMHRWWLERVVEDLVKREKLGGEV